LRNCAESPKLHFLAEQQGHLDRLHGLMQAARIAGPTVHDAHIAALGLDHGVSELWTADRDFSRVPSLKTRNPLVA
jgi:predicted nucleic acid-binding protein